MDGCVLLTSTPSCVVSPRGETTHSGVDVNNTHPSMINPLISTRRFHQYPWHNEAETKWPPFRRRHFQTHFFNENIIISIGISLKFVSKGSVNPVDKVPSLVQMMAWRRPGDKALSEPMMVRLPTHICVTQPQWVNVIALSPGQLCDHFRANQSGLKNNTEWLYAPSSN